MPVAAFKGKIVVVDNKKSLFKALQLLEKEKMVGFDTETRPSFEKGTRHKVSLMQIATDKVCFLFRLHELNGIPKELETFLNSTDCKKIGLSLRDDFHLLNRHKKLNRDSFIDLQSIIRDYGIQELSLKKMFAILFNRKISKSQRLTNWENKELSDAQKRYAATDAWAVLKIYERISTMKKSENKSEKQTNLPTDIPVFL